MPQSQITEQHMAPRGRDIEHLHPHDGMNTIKVKQPTLGDLISKLEWTLKITSQNNDQIPPTPTIYIVGNEYIQKIENTCN